ncbi:unnamed protein product, partial [Discosporangium mesarthrocarpum]
MNCSCLNNPSIGRSLGRDNSTPPVLPGLDRPTMQPIGAIVSLLLLVSPAFGFTLTTTAATRTLPNQVGNRGRQLLNHGARNAFACQSRWFSQPALAASSSKGTVWARAMSGMGVGRDIGRPLPNGGDLMWGTVLRATKTEEIEAGAADPVVKKKK